MSDSARPEQVAELLRRLSEAGFRVEEDPPARSDARWFFVVHLREKSVAYVSWAANEGFGIDIDDVGFGECAPEYWLPDAASTVALFVNGLTTEVVLAGLLRSLPMCDLCALPATRAAQRGTERFCDTHGPDVREYPRARWIRRARERLGVAAAEEDALRRPFSPEEEQQFEACLDVSWGANIDRDALVYPLQALLAGYALTGREHGTLRKLIREMYAFVQAKEKRGGR